VWPRRYGIGLMENVSIQATDLARSFGEVQAVRGVSLEVGAGEIYGFLGPNGAGKSTVVRMLCTLLLPSAGTANVAGFDVVEAADEVRLRIGVALQEAAIDDKQSGREILMLQARLYGLSKAEAQNRLDEVAHIVDFDAIDRRVGEYSGGMKRRLDLAAAIMHNPLVLFLDEPTTGLDPTSRQAVWEEVRRLNSELGMTIFLTTQYLEEADQLADRVGIIDAGVLAAEGTPAELKKNVGSDVVIAQVRGDVAAAQAATSALAGVTHVDASASTDREGSPRGELVISVSDGPAAVSPVAVALAESGVEVRELTLRAPTLDDVFFELTGGRIGDDGPAGVASTPAAKEGS
jgi:ABC-2 type transport system ATP-binding protein